jgi:hypothetical protein
LSDNGRLSVRGLGNTKRPAPVTGSISRKFEDRFLS